MLDEYVSLTLWEENIKISVESVPLMHKEKAWFLSLVEILRVFHEKLDIPLVSQRGN